MSFAKCGLILLHSGGHDGLCFQVVLDSAGAPFAAVAGLFVTAERGPDIIVRAVEVHHAGPQLPRYGHGFFGRRAVHVTGQAIVRVVGNRDASSRLE